MLNVGSNNIMLHHLNKSLSLSLPLLLLGVPCITDCVVAELEKLGSRFRVAQRCVYVLHTTKLVNHFLVVL